MKDYIAKIVVEVGIDGYKRAPLEAGYRPNLVISGSYYPSCIMRISGGKLAFGDSGLVDMEVIVPEAYKAPVVVGAPIEFREGAKRLGSGVIREVIGFEDNEPPPAQVTLYE